MKKSIALTLCLLTLPNNIFAMRGFNLVNRLTHSIGGFRAPLLPLVAPYGARNIIIPAFPMPNSAQESSESDLQHNPNRSTSIGLTDKFSKPKSSFQKSRLRKKIEALYDHYVDEEQKSLNKLEDWIEKNQVYFFSIKDIPTTESFAKNIAFGRFACISSESKDMWVGAQDDTHKELIVALYDWEKYEASLYVINNIEELSSACEKVRNMSPRTSLHVFIAPEATIGSNARAVTFIQCALEIRPERDIRLIADIEPYAPRSIMMNTRNGELRIVTGERL